jgi:hypothetical protein
MPPTATANAPTLPFEIASQYSSRPSLVIPNVSLQASAPTPITPQQIPAVGYINGLLLEVIITGSGGTTPAFTADGPFNVIQTISLRNAAGVNLIAPVNGYDLYVMNKFGGQVNPGFGPYADPKFGLQYSATAPSAHFFLWVPLILDPTTGLGAIPALASNASYQLDATLASIATVLTGGPSVSVTINADAYYFDLPASQDSTGVAQATTPEANGTTSIWLKESPAVVPGTQFVQSFNVGNVIRNHIMVLRNSAGARIDTNGWPNLFELYIDNNPRFSFRRNVFENLMSRWYGLGAATKDIAGGLDTGVYAIPYHALLNGVSGDANNTRAQLLPTITGTLLQMVARDFGSAASTLQIFTQTVSTASPQVLFGK